MTKKLKPILADAVAVIAIHETHQWESFCNTYKIAITATVLEDELFYFQSKRGKMGFAPSKWVQQGKITRIEAALEDYEMLRSKLSPDFMAAIDPGEHEALAILLAKTDEKFLFATADRAAIKALGVLGLGSQGISIEELLQGMAASPTAISKLPRHHTKNWFRQALAEGFGEQHLWLRTTKKT